MPPEQVCLSQLWDSAAAAAALTSLRSQPGGTCAACSTARVPPVQQRAGWLLRHTHCLAVGAAGGATLGSTAAPLCALSRLGLGAGALPPFTEGFLQQGTHCSRRRLPGHIASGMSRRIHKTCMAPSATGSAGVDCAKGSSAVSFSSSAHGPLNVTLTVSASARAELSFYLR